MNMTIIWPDNGLGPFRYNAIIYVNADIYVTSLHVFPHHLLLQGSGLLNKFPQFR